MTKRIILALALLVSIICPAYAEELSSESAEAKVFFNKILQESNNPIITRLVRQSLNKLESNTLAQSTVSQTQTVEVSFLTRGGSNLAVPVMLEGSTMGTFLVDTGATYTVITPRMAKKLGIVITPETPTISIATANGLVNAPLVTLGQVNIGGVEVRNVKVVVHNLGNDILLAGLLGMNFFKDMDLTIKQDKLILHVSQAD